MANASRRNSGPATAAVSAAPRVVRGTHPRQTRAGQPHPSRRAGVRGPAGRARPTLTVLVRACHSWLGTAVRGEEYPMTESSSGARPRSETFDYAGATVELVDAATLP